MPVPSSNVKAWYLHRKIADRNNNSTSKKYQKGKQQTANERGKTVM
jgi:hypothetical protein